MDSDTDGNDDGVAPAMQPQPAEEIANKLDVSMLFDLAGNPNTSIFEEYLLAMYARRLAEKVKAGQPLNLDSCDIDTQCDVEATLRNVAELIEDRARRLVETQLESTKTQTLVVNTAVQYELHVRAAAMQAGAPLSQLVSTGSQIEIGKVVGNLEELRNLLCENTNVCQRMLQDIRKDMSTDRQVETNRGSLADAATGHDQGVAWRVAIDNVSELPLCDLQVVVAERKRDVIRLLREVRESEFEFESTEVQTEIETVSTETQVTVDTISIDVQAESETISTEIQATVETVSTDVQAESETVSTETQATVETVSIDVQSEGETISTEIQATVETVSIDVQSEGETVSTETQATVETVSIDVQAEGETVSTETQATVETVSIDVQSEGETVSTEIQATVETVSTDVQYTIETVSTTSQVEIETVSSSMQSEMETVSTYSQCAIETVSTGEQVAVETVSISQQTEPDTVSTGQQSENRVCDNDTQSAEVLVIDDSDEVERQLAWRLALKHINELPADGLRSIVEKRTKEVVSELSRMRSQAAISVSQLMQVDSSSHATQSEPVAVIDPSDHQAAWALVQPHILKLTSGNLNKIVVQRISDISQLLRDALHRVNTGSQTQVLLTSGGNQTESPTLVHVGTHDDRECWRLALESVEMPREGLKIIATRQKKAVIDVLREVRAAEFTSVGEQADLELPELSVHELADSLLRDIHSAQQLLTGAPVEIPRAVAPADDDVVRVTKRNRVEAKNRPATVGDSLDGTKRTRGRPNYADSAMHSDAESEASAGSTDLRSILRTDRPKLLAVLAQIRREDGEISDVGCDPHAELGEIIGISDVRRYLEVNKHNPDHAKAVISAIEARRCVYAESYVQTDAHDSCASDDDYDDDQDDFFCVSDKEDFYDTENYVHNVAAGKFSNEVAGISDVIEGEPGCHRTTDSNSGDVADCDFGCSSSSPPPVCENGSTNGGKASGRTRSPDNPDLSTSQESLVSPVTSQSTAAPDSPTPHGLPTVPVFSTSTVLESPTSPTSPVSPMSPASPVSSSPKSVEPTSPVPPASQVPVSPVPSSVSQVSPMTPTSQVSPMSPTSQVSPIPSPASQVSSVPPMPSSASQVSPVPSVASQVSPKSQVLPMSPTSQVSQLLPDAPLPSVTSSISPVEDCRNDCADSGIQASSASTLNAETVSMSPESTSRHRGSKLSSKPVERKLGETLKPVSNNGKLGAKTRGSKLETKPSDHRTKKAAPKTSATLYTAETQTDDLALCVSSALSVLPPKSVQQIVSEQFPVIDAAIRCLGQPTDSSVPVAKQQSPPATVSADEFNQMKQQNKELCQRLAVAVRSCSQMVTAIQEVRALRVDASSQKNSYDSSTEKLEILCEQLDSLNDAEMELLFDVSRNLKDTVLHQARRLTRRSNKTVQTETGEDELTIEKLRAELEVTKKQFEACEGSAKKMRLVLQQTAENLRQRAVPCTPNEQAEAERLKSEMQQMQKRMGSLKGRMLNSLVQAGPAQVPAQTAAADKCSATVVVTVADVATMTDQGPAVRSRSVGIYCFNPSACPTPRITEGGSRSDVARQQGRHQTGQVTRPVTPVTSAVVSSTMSRQGRSPLLLVVDTSRPQLLLPEDAQPNVVTTNKTKKPFALDNSVLSSYRPLSASGAFGFSNPNLLIDSTATSTSSDTNTSTSTSPISICLSARQGRGRSLTMLSLPHQSPHALNSPPESCSGSSSLSLHNSDAEITTELVL